MTRSLTAALCLSLGLPAGVRADDPEPKGRPATELLAAGLAEAGTGGKAVFLAFGSPSCGWCKYLDKFHARPAVAKALARHLVFVKVDVVDNPGGQELYKKYTPPSGGGVPVWVVLSADGEVLADSFEDKKKNVGFPYQPNELAHYETAMRAALPKLTDDEVALLMRELKAAGPEKKK